MSAVKHSNIVASCSGLVFWGYPVQTVTFSQSCILPKSSHSPQAPLSAIWR